jgi:hypothetical protein
MKFTTQKQRNIQQKLPNLKQLEEAGTRSRLTTNKLGIEAFVAEKRMRKKERDAEKILGKESKHGMRFDQGYDTY